MQIHVPQSTASVKEGLETSKIDPFQRSLYTSAVHYAKGIQTQANDFPL